jgi:tetratricopeptide (TPR) repeat protein
VRKEVLSFQADPRQPERGQYGFLQELLRQVAYETLSRRDRKARHLAAVTALEQTFEGADYDVPEVIAAHLLSAAEALPDDPDVAEIRLRARASLVLAGERAAGLAAPDEAQRYLDQAAGLAAAEPHLQAELLLRAGRLALEAGTTGEARERLEQAIRLHEEEGDALAAARAGVALADIDHREGQIDDATRRMEAVLLTLEQSGTSPELAAALAQLGRMQSLRGEPEAAATLERALRLAEALALEEVFVQALTSKATVLLTEGRSIEARILLEAALARARAGELQSALARAANNLGALLEDTEQYTDEIALTAEIEAFARQRGNRESLASARVGPVFPLAELGRWQEALARAAEAEQLQASRWALSEVISVILVLCEQGRPDEAELLLREHEWLRDAHQAELPTHFAAVEARVLRARGRPAEALAAAERGLSHLHEVGPTNRRVKLCLVEAVEAALELDDTVKAEELLAFVDRYEPGDLAPTLVAQRSRFQARLDARRDRHDDVDREFQTAETIFAEHGLVFHRAATQLEHAEWLVGRGRAQDAVPLLTEARRTFEGLEAVPWLERLEAAAAAAPAAVSV